MPEPVLIEYDLQLTSDVCPKSHLTTRKCSSPQPHNLQKYAGSCTMRSSKPELYESEVGYCLMSTFCDGTPTHVRSLTRASETVPRFKAHVCGYSPSASRRSLPNPTMSEGWSHPVKTLGSESPTHVRRLALSTGKLFPVKVAWPAETRCESYRAVS